jgi:hypothetical protein
MSRRSQLEHEVSLAQKRIKEAPKNTPANGGAESLRPDLERVLRLVYRTGEDKTVG